MRGTWLPIPDDQMLCAGIGFPREQRFSARQVLFAPSLYSLTDYAR